MGALQSAWANARLDGSETRATDLRHALGTYIGQGNRTLVPFSQGLLAEIEAERDAAGALSRIDEALGLARDAGERWSDAFLHRLRGEILLMRDPANTAPAEEAFQAAVAVAQQQKARSFELQAALSLVKRYQSTGRVAEAPRNPGTRARRLYANSRNAGDRRGDVAVCAVGVGLLGRGGLFGLAIEQPV